MTLTCPYCGCAISHKATAHDRAEMKDERFTAARAEIAKLKSMLAMQARQMAAMDRKLRDVNRFPITSRYRAFNLVG